MRRYELPTGYVTSMLGCFSAFDKTGATLGRFGTRREALAVVEAPRSPQAQIRMAIISELAPSPMEIPAINLYTDETLAEWAELLGL